MILCRFRQECVAFMTDIQSMFHQFVVTNEHRDLLRFLWWKDGDHANAVVEYRLKVIFLVLLAHLAAQILVLRERQMMGRKSMEKKLLSS